MRLRPHTIISWSRLLAGQYRDPQIGRDILTGASFALVVLLLDQTAYLLAPTLGYSNSPSLAEANAINGALGVRSYLTVLSTSVTGAVSVSMYLFLAFFIMRLILRKEWVAGAVLIVLISASNALNASAPYIGAFLGFVFGLGIVVILRRSGLVGLLALLLYAGILQSFPITADFSLWFSTASVFTMLILAALAIYAFRIPLAGKPAFSFDLLKEQ